MTVIDEAGRTTRSVVHTACTLDCPDACSLAVTVTMTSEGRRITDIDASPDSTFTDGWICAKVKRHAPVSYTHLRAHETPEHLVCRLLLEKKKKKL